MRQPMAPWPNALEEQPEELDEDYYNHDSGNDDEDNDENPAPLLQQHDGDQPTATVEHTAKAVPLRTAPAQLQLGDSPNWERVTLQLHTDTLVWQHDSDSSTTALQLSAVSAVQAQGGGDAGVLLLGRGSSGSSSSSEVLLRLRGDSESATEEWRACIDSALAAHTMDMV
jgi:hypothetical protein